MTGPPLRPGDGDLTSTPAGIDRGVWYGVAAYGIWGIFPLYFAALRPAGAWEILAHRIAWTLLFCAIVIAVRRDVGWLRPLLARRRTLAGIAVAALLIAVNWLVYVAAVTAGHVTDASLGYFLNPLVTVALGVVVLRETLRPMQAVAVLIGAAGAAYLSLTGGSMPAITITLAVTFALYGLTKKRLGATLPALHGLTMETVILAPAAVALLVWVTSTNLSTYVGQGAWHTTLLSLTGVATAIPLLFFAAAARRIPLVTIGLLQFMTPGLQLASGVLLLGEHMTPTRWVGFGIVWLALLVLTFDSVSAARRRRPTPIEPDLTEATP